MNWIKTQDQLPPLSHDPNQDAEVSKVLLIWVPQKNPRPDNPYGMEIHFGRYMRRGDFGLWTSATAGGSGPLEPTHWAEWTPPLASYEVVNVPLSMSCQSSE